MYSPVKSNKEVQMNAVKTQKRNQLAVLLVNKFRNKFNISTTVETEIDAHVVAEVQKLLFSGSAKQAALRALD